MYLGEAESGGDLPHPAPLPPGEREFLDENQAKKKELSNTS